MVSGAWEVSLDESAVADNAASSVKAPAPKEVPWDGN
jgi:hypothetical protein